MKVAIAGYGIEGKASYEYWRSPDNELVIADERESVEGLPEEAETILGSGAFARLDSADLIIRSPSVYPDKLPYGDKVWSSTNEFFEICPAPIIGVTGTKGKGTTSSLIASILEAGGKTVHLIGNIGKPALAELAHITADDIVVFELSSFQLWDAKRSPHIAVILGIEPDHLDVHHDMAEYVAAKANITHWQSGEDTLVFNSDNKIATDIAEKSHAQKIKYPFDMTSFADALVIPGQHNVENAAAAIAAVNEYVKDEATIRAGLANFTGLPHRLKFVREVSGVKFYDDSIATTPGSAIAAMKSFNEPKLLILGGSDKGADYTEVVHMCKLTDAHVIAIGQTGKGIAEICEDMGVAYTREEGNMHDIVRSAFQQAKEGSVVILSPASASFDMFKSYTDRGDQFIAAVNSL